MEIGVVNQEVSHHQVKVVRFSSGHWMMEVTYAYDEGIPRWEMRLPEPVIWPENVSLLEAAIHELRRLNGTLPPVRIGGTWPAKETRNAD